MSLPAAYQLALEMFDLTTDTIVARRTIWNLLAPIMSQVAKEHERRNAQFAPYYSDLVEKKHERNAQVIAAFTERLFTHPFDEAWVASTKERVKAERELDFDMRLRPVISAIILSHLNHALTQKRWWSKRKCLALAELAERVLTMDSANAAAVHYSIEARKAETKTNKLNTAIINFGETIENVRQAIAAAVDALDSTSQQLAGLATSAAEQVHKGAAAANNAAADVSRMASATEELNTSISEIRRQAGVACSRAQEAVSDANEMNRVVQLLSQAVGKIGSVVSLIAEIADQTNLLALNATIEAARAGEHGRGFAVVASEVKALAGQTADATRRISDQIAYVKEATQESMHEITETTGKIMEIANVSELVADSVSKQVVASTEIAASTNDAARNAVDAADSLRIVTSVVNSTKDSAGLVLDSARQLILSMRKMDEAMDDLLLASSEAGIQKLADLKSKIAA
jgi:methyl-accepting chemotaxis protein